MNRIVYFILAVMAVPVFIGLYLHREEPVLFMVGTVEVVLIAIVVTAFVIRYSRRNWRANQYGRALMYSKISLAALADLSVLIGLLGPDWSGRSIVRLLVFTGILITQARLLYLLETLDDEPYDVSKLRNIKEKDGDSPTLSS